GVDEIGGTRAHALDVLLMPELARERADGAIDRSETRDTPWNPSVPGHRDYVRNSCRETHLGRRSIAIGTQQAGHMDASDPIEFFANTSCGRGPSTYGFRARHAFALRASAGAPE